MKIAIIGCGMMANLHATAIHSLGYSIHLVVGHKNESTVLFAKKFKIPNWSLNLEDALAQFSIDTIHICTPPTNHYEVIKIALKHKVHVICEKPFVLDNNQADELVDLSLEMGVTTAVGFNVRFHDAIKVAKREITDQKLGKIFLVSGSYKQEFHALPVNYSWRYDKDSAGLMLATTEIGSHWIDLMIYLTGKLVESVSATFSNLYPKRKLIDSTMYPYTDGDKDTVSFENEDTAIITFKLNDGTLANVVLTEMAQGRSNYLNIEINGSGGSFWWDSENLNHSNYAYGKNQGYNHQTLAFTGGFNDSIKNMIDDFYRVVDCKMPVEKANFATFKDGFENIKICNAIYKSAHSNSEWVSIN